jgi:hypothetical protein
MIMVIVICLCAAPVKILIDYQCFLKFDETLQFLLQDQCLCAFIRTVSVVSRKVRKPLCRSDRWRRRRDWTMDHWTMWLRSRGDEEIIRRPSYHESRWSKMFVWPQVYNKSWWSILSERPSQLLWIPADNNYSIFWEGGKPSVEQ